MNKEKYHFNVETGTTKRTHFCKYVNFNFTDWLILSKGNFILFKSFVHNSSLYNFHMLIKYVKICFSCPSLYVLYIVQYTTKNILPIIAPHKHHRYSGVMSNKGTCKSFFVRCIWKEFEQ